jgi:hypothetical protein
MSHDGSWRAACLNRNWILILQFEVPSVARGVTDPGVGSGDLLGISVVRDFRRTGEMPSFLSMPGYRDPNGSRDKATSESDQNDDSKRRHAVLISRNENADDKEDASQDEQHEVLSTWTSELIFFRIHAGGFLPNVKDEPRRDLARGVPFVTKPFRRSIEHDS